MNPRMHKGLFYCRINRHDPMNSGIVQKYQGLIKGFRQLGWEMDIVWYNEEGILLNDIIVHQFSFAASTAAVKNLLFHYLLYDRIIAGTVDFGRYDCLFIRYPLSHPAFIWLLKSARFTNPKLKILLEVATYPYDLEQSGFLRRMQLRLDQFCSRNLRKYVDTTVHYGDFSSLFGIPSIAIRNGVDVAGLPISKSVAQVGVLRLIAVGNWNYWHGLDRLIAGLGDYYAGKMGTTKVELTIVGSGRMMEAYRRMVEALDLQEQVRFVSPVEGKVLNDLFDEADLAIGCLGMFRKKVTLDSSLKHREYCARGLPMVLSGDDPDFEGHLAWVHRVVSDETPVSILGMIEFFRGIAVHGALRKEMRRYAESHLDWSVKIAPLLPYIR